ncbi:MAG: hypothetical protein ACKO5P_08290 [Nodosilinea sp.]
MLNSLLTAFRQCYPKGSMVSEMLTIHDGFYIVRVTLNTEGLTLATALAAQLTVEAAEDKALQRALERLELALTFQPNRIDQPQPAVTNPIPISLPTTSATVASGNDSQTNQSPIAESPSSPIAVMAPLPTSEVEPVPAEQPLSMETIALAPIDLSDIIAQTDVELQRLGWGTSQGREFLERTYGKRSRHDLSDEELLEFLLYLESQPSSPATTA